PGIDRSPRGRRGARVLAHRGPLVDGPAVAPPLLGAGHDRRTRPRRLPRTRGRTLVPSSLILRSLGAIARLCRDGAGPRVRPCAAPAAREPSNTSLSCCSWRSHWAVEPPP